MCKCNRCDNKKCNRCNKKCKKDKEEDDFSIRIRPKRLFFDYDFPDLEKKDDDKDDDIKVVKVKVD
jgi:hypothetical protein